MRSTVNLKLAVLLSLVLVGFIVLFAFPAEADKSRMEFADSLTVPANSYQYKTTTIFVPAAPDSVDYVASFDVPIGDIVKFYPFDLALFELWQEGKYQPDWVEGNHGEYRFGISSQTAQNWNHYLVVLNEASAPISVNVQLAKVWHQSSYLGLFVGSAVASLGIGITPVLMFGKSKRYLLYSITLFAIAFILVANLTWAQYWSYPPNPTYTLIQAVPVVFFFEAFPLIALLYMLHRNNAFAYLRNWNMGRQLQISGAFLMSGYFLPLAFMVLRMLSLLFYYSLDSDMLTSFSVITGSLLMAVGTTLFIGLWATHHQRKYAATIPDLTKQ